MGAFVKLALVALIVVAGFAALRHYRGTPPPEPAFAGAVAGGVAANVARADKARPVEPPPTLPEPSAGREDPSCLDAEAERRQIDLALRSGVGLVGGDVRRIAAGAAIWHPVGACSYTGRYEEHGRSDDSMRASMEFRCAGTDTDTGRPFQQTVWWPARLERVGSSWIWDADRGRSSR